MNKIYKDKPIKVPRFKESEGFYTTGKRSRIMSKIKSKNTKPELIFRKELFKRGIRYRVNVKNLPGAPDIANISKKFVVFIDGEFWHGYNWEIKKQKIKSNRRFWIPKIERNIQRDESTNQKLRDQGFKVFRFWEHQVKKDLKSCVDMVVNYINSMGNQ